MEKQLHSLIFKACKYLMSLSLTVYRKYSSMSRLNTGSILHPILESVQDVWV